MQLNLFPKLPNHYIMNFGQKKDFIVDNADAYPLSDDVIFESDISQFEYLYNKNIEKLKSEAWSANCKFFFVLQDKGIFLFYVNSNQSIFCKKHSKKFIELFLNTNS